MSNEIENIDEFIFHVNRELDNAKLFINKEMFDSGIINKTNDEYLKYYSSKRKKLLKKFNDKSFLLRIEFNENVKLNSEDFEQLLVVPNYAIDFISRHEDALKTFDDENLSMQLANEKKDLKKYFKLRIKDLKNSIKLSYYNLRIEQLQNYDNGFENYNKEYLNIFKLNGFELFQYINKELDITAQTVKYTVMYHFMDELGLMVGTIENYLLFVKPYLKKDLKFSRFDFHYKTDEKYKKHLQRLTLIHKEFLEPQ